ALVEVCAADAHRLGTDLVTHVRSPPSRLRFLLANRECDGALGRDHYTTGHVQDVRPTMAKSPDVPMERERWRTNGYAQPCCRRACPLPISPRPSKWIPRRSNGGGPRGASRSVSTGLLRLRARGTVMRMCGREP